MITRLLLFILGVVFSFQVWGYVYDAVLDVSSYGNIEFDIENQHYDGTPNLCYRCINPFVENLQEKTQDGSFLAFEVGLVAAKGANPRTLIETTRAVLRQKAGFSNNGTPIILDKNLERSGLANSLRAKGFNVRSVTEICGKVDPGDPAIDRLANQLGGRVLTQDRGRQIGEGFGSNAILVNARANGLESILRLLGQ